MLALELLREVLEGYAGQAACRNSVIHGTDPLAEGDRLRLTPCAWPLHLTLVSDTGYTFASGRSEESP